MTFINKQRVAKSQACPEVKEECTGCQAAERNPDSAQSKPKPPPGQPPKKPVCHERHLHISVIYISPITVMTSRITEQGENAQRNLLPMFSIFTFFLEPGKDQGLYFKPHDKRQHSW